jgi:hypothetical protein
MDIKYGNAHLINFQHLIYHMTLPISAETVPEEQCTESAGWESGANAKKIRRIRRKI